MLGPGVGGKMVEAFEPDQWVLDCILCAAGAMACLHTCVKERSDRSKQCFGERNLAAAWEMDWTETERQARTPW